MLDCEKIRSRREFLTLRKQGKFFVVRGFCTQFAPKEGQRATRLGVTASRKVGGAVVRNRAKRRLKALFRSVKDEIKSGLDINLIATKATPQVKWSEMEKSMRFFLMRNQLQKDQQSNDKKQV